MNTNFIDLLQKHIETWGEKDRTQRRKMIESIDSENCYYVDPIDEIIGRDEMDSLIERIQTQFPGFKFSIDSPINTHHNITRFAWHFGPDGMTVVSGVDVVMFEGGFIRSMYGFFDKP
jgi:hypothetical protein